MVQKPLCPQGRAPPAAEEEREGLSGAEVGLELKSSYQSESICAGQREKSRLPNFQRGKLRPRENKGWSTKSTKSTKYNLGVQEEKLGRTGVQKRSQTSLLTSSKLWLQPLPLGLVTLHTSVALSPCPPPHILIRQIRLACREASLGTWSEEVLRVLSTPAVKSGGSEAESGWAVT